MHKTTNIYKTSVKKVREVKVIREVIKLYYRSIVAMKYFSHNVNLEKRCCVTRAYYINICSWLLLRKLMYYYYYYYFTGMRK